MRRWTRDRNKRRKPGDKPTDKPAGDGPAPLQPRFPDPSSGQPTESRQPEFEAQPDESELHEAPPMVDGNIADGAQPQAKRGDRNRRRGRRGRGNRPQQARPPVLPGPGGPTGEGAEAESPAEIAEPTAQPAAVAHSKQPKGAVVLSIGLPGSGKSTWFKRHNILPLSSDMVRILLFDDVT